MSEPRGHAQPRSPPRPATALPCTSPPAKRYLVLGGLGEEIYIHGNAQIYTSIMSTSATKNGFSRFEASCLKFKPHLGLVAGSEENGEKGSFPRGGTQAKSGRGGSFAPCTLSCLLNASICSSTTPASTGAQAAVSPEVSYVTCAERRPGTYGLQH